MRAAIVISALFVLVVAACKKDNENPFDQLERASPNPPTQNLPTDNFAWLHQHVFHPVCANSGCHDGNFEPDFRSISSAYNSLVYAPVIANTPNDGFTFRVVPGNVNASFLHERLTTFVPNTSGMMPLETDGPDWPEHHEQYLSAIMAWIAGGAKDMFGTIPVPGDREPQVIGLLAFTQGSTSTPFARGEGEGVQPIDVPASIVDMWFALADDSTATTALTYNKLKLATSLNGFSTVPEQGLATGTSITGPDLGGDNATFTHRATVDLTSFTVGTLLYVRIYVNDGHHTENTEIPNAGTGEPMRDYFTLRIVP